MTSQNKRANFLVKFFDLNEVFESHEKSNLLVSNSFLSTLSSVPSDCNTYFYFIFQDMKSFMGSAKYNPRLKGTLDINEVRSG